MKKRFEDTNYWQSYSDMMAALLLIFILIIAVAFVQLKGQENELNNQKKELRIQSDELQKQKAMLEQQKMMIEQQQSVLTEKEKLLAEKSDAFIKLNDKLLETQEKLDKIIGIKAQIIESLNKEFNGQNIEITLDSGTGAIRFQSNILFDTEESKLLPEGKEYLKAFLPVYFKILLSEDYKEYISEIIIEGNCDSRGTYEANLVLSQERAYAVAVFVKEVMRNEMDSKAMDQMLKLLSINGRSNKNLVYGSDNQENMDASRRVELKFRLKDEEMIEEMSKIMEGEY